MADGRFAPSPTGDLHLGNLRTALVAWLFARRAGSRFLLRMEDLDPATRHERHVVAQQRDLAAIGLDWDGEVVCQSARLDRYHAAIDHLTASGLTYPCYCTRREVHEAAAAPQGPYPALAYPGTCRHLSVAERAEREAAGRLPALRLRADGVTVRFTDRCRGLVEGAVDDLVLRRRDGVPAYNLAVVVDDAAQGVEEVVRGDDLLDSTPRQLHLAALLGLPAPCHAHVPLVLGPDGARLAKRHGGVTLADRLAAGQTVTGVVGMLAASLGLADRGEPLTAVDLLDRFDPTRLSRRPWVLTDPDGRPDRPTADRS